MIKAQLMAAMEAITGALLLALIVGLNIGSVLSVPKPEKLDCDILDGEVTVTWQHPEGAPPNSQYNVQMFKNGGDWEKVQSCTGITDTYCELSSLIHNYRTAYKVKVQLVAGVHESAWTTKKFLPNDSKLRVPTFNVLVTSSSLTVNIVPRPFLKKLFLYGLKYTIFLEERGNRNRNTTAYMTDDKEEALGPKTFEFLLSEQEYCVSVTVEGVGSPDISRASTQCLKLPKEEWYMTAVLSLSALGVLCFAAFVTAIMLCYLKRPEKTPLALKSPSSDWRPLSIAEGPVEVVTDRGWFLSKSRTQGRDQGKAPVTSITVTEDSDEEDRRTSMDSGVSMEPHSIQSQQERPPVRHDDSGLGSLGGQEGSSSSQTTYSLLKDRGQTDGACDRGDSGVEWGFRSHSPCSDVKPPKEAVYGGNYCSQTPRDGVIEDNEVELSWTLNDPSLAEVIQHYRAGLQSCICSGAGHCTWCHKNAPRVSQTTDQHRVTRAENGPQSGTCHLTDACKGIPSSFFPKDTQTDSLTVNDLLPFTQLQEAFPMLSAFTPLPPMAGGQDINMNHLSLSLCDVQLITD